jgi:hypothetical protein
VTGGRPIPRSPRSAARFAEEDVLGSKLEGATWARERWPDPGVIDAAVALRHGHDAALDQGAVDTLLATVENRLQQQRDVTA